MSICRAYKVNGKPCTHAAKDNGYCGVHKNAAARRDESPPVGRPVRTGTPTPSPMSVPLHKEAAALINTYDTTEICKAIVKKTGKPCTHAAKDNGYCGVHKNAAARRDESPPPTPSPMSVPLHKEAAALINTYDTSEICKAIVKKTGKPCTHAAKGNGYCGNHKNLAAGNQASVALAPSTPPPSARLDTDTAGKGFGILGLFGKGKKAENKTKATGRRGAMAEVLKICKTEEIEDPHGCCGVIIGSGVQCPKEATCWLVKGKIGFCDYKLHKPGQGVLLSMQAYIIKNEDTIPLRVEDPTKTMEQVIKDETLNALREKISKAINDNRGWLRQNINFAPDRGYLYCYRNKADGIPASKGLTQRPIKCGKAQESNWPARFNTQRTHYNDKGDEVEYLGSIRVPFITQVDTYVKHRLEYWKLPSRAVEGGTEWYYISLQKVEGIWKEARKSALEEGRKYGLTDQAWYFEEAAMP